MIVSIGFTGTRVGLTTAQKATLERKLWELEEFEIHHGDCIGADQEFHEIATRVAGLRDGTLHPCNLPDKRGKAAKMPWPATAAALVTLAAKAPLERNMDIVQAASILIACPKMMVPELRGGTWSSVRHWRVHGRGTLFLIYPDGTWSKEESRND